MKLKNSNRVTNQAAIFFVLLDSINFDNSTCQPGDISQQKLLLAKPHQEPATGWHQTVLRQYFLPISSIFFMFGICAPPAQVDSHGEVPIAAVRVEAIVPQGELHQ